MSKLPYREVVGALMWTAMMTPPNTACAVRAVASFFKKTRLAHKKVVLKVTQYLLHMKE